MEQKKRRPTPQQRRNGLIINVLTLIVLVLVVFEGKSLISLFSDVSIQERIRAEEEEVFASANISSTEPETEPETKAPVAPEPTTEKQTETDPPKPDNQTGIPADALQYMDVVVPKQASPVDDSYFDDAVFIGDSRMEGFRNLSGIANGSFVSAVGMQLENFYTDAQIPTSKGNMAVFIGDSRMEGFRNLSGIANGSFVSAVGMQLENFYTDAQIPTSKGNMLVMDALKNINFSKIYVMLGTNELGAYDLDAVRESYRKVLADIKTRSSSADPTVYVYSVIYVEEALVTTGDYVNNTNVDAVNTKIMQMCQEEGYHYINLNEVFSDGHGSLIPGASQDGIHLEQSFCQKWLDYTKTHYVSDETSAEAETEAETAAKEGV